MKHYYLQLTFSMSDGLSYLIVQTFHFQYERAPIAHEVKGWPTGLAVQGSSPA